MKLLRRNYSDSRKSGMQLAQAQEDTEIPVGDVSVAND